MSPPELLTIMSQLMTPMAIMLVAVLGYPILTRWQRDNNKRQMYAERQGLLTHEVAESTDRGGFAFIEVSDDKKPFVIDLMNGFSDFARIKGYAVAFAVETGLPGKVGIKFTILDEGVTVSTETVRRDISDFIDRVRTGDDLHGMPMTVDPIEHARLVSALQTRFSHLRAQLEMKAAQEQFYKTLLTGLYQSPINPASHTPVLIQLTNNGGTTMRDNYTAANSQNVAQGTSASAVTERSKVQIGSNYIEKAQQIAKLQDLEDAIRATEPANDHLRHALRHVENAKEELTESAEPKPDAIATWLDRAGGALKAAGSAADLIEKFHSALEAFGIA